MYSSIVGGMKFSPTEFWNMTLHEAYLVIDGDEKRQENDIFSYYYASLNAIGGCFNKKHEFINPYDKKKKKNKSKKKTAEELKTELDDLIKGWR